MQTRLRLGPSSVLVPADWETGSVAGTPDVVHAREPADSADPERFRADVVLVRESLDGLDLSAWQNAADAVLPSVLTDYLLVDLERREVAGRPGGRRLAHHVEPGGRAVVMEQWFTCAGAAGYTVTTTVDVHRFDLLAEIMSAIGESLQIGAEVP